MNITDNIKKVDIKDIKPYEKNAKSYIRGT